MQESLKNTIQDVVKQLNSYTDSKEYKYIEEIEDELRSLFEAEVVNFWNLDNKKGTLSCMDGDEKKILLLESSLIKQAIDSKKILLENHVTSDKYYNAAIDNPLALKIKALIVFPILKGKEVVGVLKIWRGIKQRKVFNKKDEDKLNTLAPLLLKVLKGKNVDKEELLRMLGEKQNKTTLKSYVTSKVKSKVSMVKNVERPNKELIELEALKKEFVALEKENKSVIKSYKDKIATLEKSYKVLEKSKAETSDTKNHILLKEKIANYDHELEASRLKYEELEESSLELYTESQLQQVTIKDLEKELQLLKKENKYLQLDLKEKEKDNSVKSIKDLKSEKSLLSQRNSNSIDANIEHILQYVDNDFTENEYAYMLFELVLYALHSKKGLAYIEESVKKSKVVQQIIDGYYFKGDLQVHNEKNRISDLVTHIKSYEKNIFSNMIKLKVNVEDDMPASLVFDRAKIQSSILHLLTDLHQFVGPNKELNINFTFKKKFLNIELGGFIHKKNSLFKTMFKQTKLGGDEKDRIGLQLSKKIITRLKGEIHYLYEDDYYKFILTVPTQVIKM